ncbi:hypothetical protein F6P94_16460 [Escherichia coli]|nr:hypothetical protein F6P94_16460 [Escherichia coli]
METGVVAVPMGNKARSSPDAVGLHAAVRKAFDTARSMLVTGRHVFMLAGARQLNTNRVLGNLKLGADYRQRL